MRSGMKMMAVNEMRRRRDSRGRFMEGGGGGQMEMGYSRMEGGGQGNYNRMEGGGGSSRMGGYDRMESEMRGGGGRMESEMRRGGGGRMEAEMRGGRGGGNRSEGGNMNRMEEGGASAHYWPMPTPPPYGGEEMEMRRGGQGSNRNKGTSMGGYGGFVWDEGGSENRMEGGSNIVDMRQYGRRYNADRARMTMGGQERQRMIGFASSKGEEKFSREDAEEWVAEMKGSDPAHPMGPKWTPEQVKPYAQKYGFPTEGEKFWEFYAIMNAMYADSFETAKEFNLVKPEFFASLAKGWLNDKDAVPNKTQMYYECIVK